MKFNLNRSNWFSRVLVGTAILATLGVLVPEVVKGDNEETVSVSAQKQQMAATAYNSGQVAIRQQNYQEAIANFDRAIAANPQHAQAYRDRGLAHQGMGDYAQAKEDLRRSASLFLQAEDNVGLYNTMRLISDVKNTFECRQNSDGEYQTVMNRHFQTYPVITWHDQRVMDLDVNGEPQHLADVESKFSQRDQEELGQIPHFSDIPSDREIVNMTTLSRVRVTTTVASDPSNNTAQGRCLAISERLNNMDHLIFKGGAQNLFTVATLPNQETGIHPVTGRWVTMHNKIQAACIADPQNGCDKRNAIFTLTGQSEKKAQDNKLNVNETNEQRLARFVRLIDNPGSGDPIHN